MSLALQVIDFNEDELLANEADSTGAIKAVA